MSTCTALKKTASRSLSPREVAQRRWFARTPARASAVISALYTAEHARVERPLGRRGLSPAEAEEACHDVFVIALRRLPTFLGTSSLTTWLLGIAQKVAADQRRSARARCEQLVESVPEGETVERPGEDF